MYVPFIDRSARISMRVDRVECRIDSPFDCDQIELWIVILRQVLVVLWIFFCVCMRLEYYKDRIDMGIDWGFAYQIYNIFHTTEFHSDTSAQYLFCKDGLKAAISHLLNE